MDLFNVHCFYGKSALLGATEPVQVCGKQSGVIGYSCTVPKSRIRLEISLSFCFSLLP
jgi:hypothetical protein